MSKKNYSYIGVAFIILVFGIIFVPRIVERVKNRDIVSQDRMSKDELAVLKLNDIPRTVPEFLFINQDSLPISNADYKGKVWVVEFFFTSCPTICPIMNAKMKTIEELYGAREDFGIASFTIDPERDTPTKLKQYAELYEITSPNWHLMTGQKEDLMGLANTGFNMYAGVGPQEVGGFEHSGLFALIDKQGQIRSRYDANGNPIIYYRAIQEEGLPDQIAELKQDIKKLLEE